MKVKDPNSQKVKVLHLEQISTKTSHSAQLQLNHRIMQSFSSTSSSETPMEWLARRKAAFGGLQGRLQGHHLSKFDKKNFKEAFITDKSRFLKRQSKYNRSKSFLILMEDNIHSIGSRSETAGMIMAYGGGPLKEKFL